jgi:hypothetical protein
LKNTLISSRLTSRRPSWEAGLSGYLLVSSSRALALRMCLRIILRWLIFCLFSSHRLHQFRFRASQSAFALHQLDSDWLQCLPFVPRKQRGRSGQEGRVSGFVE